MPFRVLVADDLTDPAVDILRGAGLEVDVKVGLGLEELEEIIGDYDALAVRSATRVSARLLERATRLKVVGRAGWASTTSTCPPPPAAGSWS
jgi:D-3-phosphoglycerate dehydrogenase/(S)-sulfolactate dehydrogenase